MCMTHCPLGEAEDVPATVSGCSFGFEEAFGTGVYLG